MKLNFSDQHPADKTCKTSKILKQTSCYFPPKFKAEHEFERKIPCHDQPRSQNLPMNVFHKSIKIDPKDIRAHPVFRNRNL